MSIPGTTGTRIHAKVANARDDAPGDRQPARGSRGMTLLELLVALSIFAVVGTALFPVVSGALVGRRDAVLRGELAAEARAILDRLDRDVASSIDAGLPGQVPPRFVAAGERDRFGGEHDLLELTTVLADGVTAADATTGLDSLEDLATEDRGDLAHVLWRLDGDGRLLRQERRPPGTDPVDWRDEPAEVISERATLELTFYEAETWEDNWDSRERGGRAPLAVRALVGVGEGAAAIEVVTTVVLPTVAAPAPSSSRTRGTR